ncbi:PilW family protein [Acidobacteriota bacterium]
MINKKNRIWHKKGISLIENLISMTLFLIIVMGVLTVFSLSRDHFFEIKTSQEVNTAACSALDKIKTDLQQCGKGFTELLYPDIVKPLNAESNILTCRSVEMALSLQNPLNAGQTRITIPSTSGFKKGKELFFSDTVHGEIQTISSIDSTSVFLSSSLINSYPVDVSELYLLNKISFYFDKNKKVLRRKVNASPAQPLCEEVHSFECFYSTDTNLANIRLSLSINPEKVYEISVFPKNTALYSVR